MPDPRVSVVVSTYNRPGHLERLLSSLRAQTLSADAFEVIVVDNGSSAETQNVLRRQASLDGLRLRTIRHEVTRGPAGGRNSGWRLAAAPLVAFTDDDCAAEQDWLAAALRVHATHPGAVVQGRTQPDPRELGQRGVRVRTVRVDALGPQYEACNIFYPRAVLEDLGGFDEAFGVYPAGEDTDLAWRAIERGHQTVFAPEAVVYHSVESPGAVATLRIAARWSAVVRLFARHPQTRSMLYHGIFWNVWHYLVWRSLLASAAPPPLRRLIVARHLMALRARAREAGAGGGAVPFLLLHDLVECWAIARGAARYRTLVL